MKTKTYVITGSTSGIGNALLKRIAEDNIVFAGYRNLNYKERLERISSNIKPFYVDYAKPQSIKPAYEYIKSNTEKIDSLINIAGCVVAGPIENIEMNATIPKQNLKNIIYPYFCLILFLIPV